MHRRGGSRADRQQKPRPCRRRWRRSARRRPWWVATPGAWRSASQGRGRHEDRLKTPHPSCSTFRCIRGLLRRPELRPGLPFGAIKVHTLRAPPSGRIMAPAATTIADIAADGRCVPVLAHIRTHRCTCEPGTPAISGGPLKSCKLDILQGGRRDLPSRARRVRQCRPAELVEIAKVSSRPGGREQNKQVPPAQRTHYRRATRWSSNDFGLFPRQSY